MNFRGPHSKLQTSDQFSNCLPYQVQNQPNRDNATDSNLAITGKTS